MAASIFTIEAGLEHFFGRARAERVPIKWNHLIDNDSLKSKSWEHVRIKRAGRVFLDMLQAAAGNGRQVNSRGTIRLGLKRGMKGEMALVPEASIAGRALVTVVAIMTFLASLTAGAAILISDASRGW